MAILSKKQFAELCGIQTKYLSVDISRKKVDVLENDMIDSLTPKNKLYVEKKSGKINVEEFVKKDISLNASLTPDLISQLENMNYNQMEMLIKYLQSEKLKTEIEKNKIEIDKKMGVVVPSEPLIPIVKQHNHFILQEQKNADEELLLAMAHKYDIAPSDTAYLRGEWIRLRNDAVTKATNLTVKAIEDVINDFSEKRGVGQRM